MQYYVTNKNTRIFHRILLSLACYQNINHGIPVIHRYSTYFTNLQVQSYTRKKETLNESWRV